MNRLFLAVWLALAGCSLGGPEAPTAQTHLVARMQGEWRIALTPVQRQQVRTMRFLLREPPPTNEEVQQLDLNEEEAKAAIHILQEIRYDPGGERTRQLRAAIAGLEQGELSISPDRLEIRVGGVTKAGSYEVGATTGDSAHLLLTPDGASKAESVALTLTPDHELIFGAGADAISFVKR